MHNAPAEAKTRCPSMFVALNEPRFAQVHFTMQITWARIKDEPTFITWADLTPGGPKLSRFTQAKSNPV